VEAAAGLARYAAMKKNFDEDIPPRPARKVDLPFGDGVIPTVQAVSLLEEAGVAMAAVSLAKSADEAVDAWRRFGRAVALKIESPDILHKTDIGGVLLNLDDET